MRRACKFEEDVLGEGEIKRTVSSRKNWKKWKKWKKRGIRGAKVPFLTKPRERIETEREGGARLRCTLEPLGSARG
jgi:hypothetical protein